MLEYYVDNLPIAEFYSLANTPLSITEFRPICDSFAEYDSLSSDDNCLRYKVSKDLSLLVGANNGIISNAILSFCWWDSFREEHHENIATYKTEKASFDKVFADILNECINLIGSPLVQAEDADSMAHKYAIWKGKVSLFIIQQSAYDLQSGVDINFWIQPWKEGTPTPSSPFIDWLFALED